MAAIDARGARKSDWVSIAPHEMTTRGATFVVAAVAAGVVVAGMKNRLPMARLASVTRQTSNQQPRWPANPSRGMNTLTMHPSPRDVPARVEPRRPMAPVA